MIYQRESLTSLWDEAIPLLVAHWREIAHYTDIPLDPDVETYNRIEESGQLRTFTARTDSGELVGYANFFVRTNAHYRGSLQAVQDVLFIRQSYRVGFAGIKLIKFADEALRREGVQVVYHHIKAAHDIGPVLERLGYELVDKIYARRLDHGSNRSDRADRSSVRGGGQQDGSESPEDPRAARSPVDREDGRTPAAGQENGQENAAARRNHPDHSARAGRFPDLRR